MNDAKSVLKITIEQKYKLVRSELQNEKSPVGKAEKICNLNGAEVLSINPHIRQ